MGLRRLESTWSGAFSLPFSYVLQAALVPVGNDVSRQPWREASEIRLPFGRNGIIDLHRIPTAR